MKMDCTGWHEGVCVWRNRVAVAVQMEMGVRHSRGGGVEVHLIPFYAILFIPALHLASEVGLG